MLAATACGGDNGPAGSSGVAVVDAIATPTPVSSPAPAPSPAPATTANVAAPIATIVQSGDSIGIGLGAGDWAAIDHLGFSNTVMIRNVSVSGKAMEAGYGLRETELFPFRNTQGPSVLVIQQGSNDLYYGTAGNTIYQAILVPFVASARNAGFYVVVDTVLPRGDGGWTPAMERQRIIYNTLVRGDAARADAVNDVAADPVVGDVSNPAISPYYADGVHPNLMGQQRLAIVKAAVIAPFLQRVARAPSR